MAHITRRGPTNLSRVRLYKNVDHHAHLNLNNLNDLNDRTPLGQLEQMAEPNAKYPLYPIPNSAVIKHLKMQNHTEGGQSLAPPPSPPSPSSLE